MINFILYYLKLKWFPKGLTKLLLKKKKIYNHGLNYTPYQNVNYDTYQMLNNFPKVLTEHINIVLLIYLVIFQADRRREFLSRSLQF